MAKTTSKTAVKSGTSASKKFAAKTKSSAKSSASKQPSWLVKVEDAAKLFAKNNKAILKWSDRQLSAAFEIGCFHALLGFYENQQYKLRAVNLIDKQYRYLTAPTGNPANFSYVEALGADGKFEIRQQVRIESHIHEDIAFTPDVVVIRDQSVILDSKDQDYAGGKKKYFRVKSSDVVAAHECKSMNPFPELMVSFVGMLSVAHKWHADGHGITHSKEEGHLAPTLFIGGTARGLHFRMIAAMQKSFRLNVICGLHEGTWSLKEAKNRLVVGPVHEPVSNGQEMKPRYTLRRKLQSKMKSPAHG